MISEIKKYQVDIFGETYTLLSDESEKEVIKAATLIDSMMKEVADKASNIDTKKLAVLVALKIASKILDLESLYAKLKEKEALLIQAIDVEL